MKIIFKIAKAELRYLFFSPIAWFVIIIFYATGLGIYFYALEQAANYQEVLKDLQPDWAGFESGIGKILLDGVIGKLLGYMYLFIPLLTMGAINREMSNGTISLLYSSPVHSREIVLGKLLGLMLFNLMLIFVLVLVLLAVCIHIQLAEYNWYLSILLGMFLLINAFTAIGLFISCLTNYQIVAAVITFTVFFVLAEISTLWQQYDLVRDITYYLSLKGKVSGMIAGEISSRDVIYFISIIALFTGFAMIRLKSMTESRPWKVAASRYAGLTLLVIVVGYFSSRPGYIAYADVTKNKVNTIHPVTQEVLQQLDGAPLTVTLFTNLLDDNAAMGLPQARNTYLWDIWEPFTRFYPNIQFRYEYYYDIKDGDSAYYKNYPGKNLEDIMVIEAGILGIRPSLFKKGEDMRKILDLSAEGMTLVMQLEYKGKTEFLRTYGNSWPGQENISATISRLTRKKEPRITFLTGHYERNPFSYAQRNFGARTTYKKYNHSLLNNGVDTDTISLSNGEIPTGTDALVIADPRSAYSKDEQQKVIRWLNEGGNALIFTEPGKQEILQPILNSIGVQADNGIIVRPNDHEVPHLFVNGLTSAGNHLAKEPAMELFQKYGWGGIVVAYEGALNLNILDSSGFKAEPIIFHPGNDNTWIENGVLVVDSAAPVFSAAAGDVKKEAYIIALKLTRNIGGKEQRIIVAGDADFMTLDRFSMARFIELGFYSWVLNNEYPFYANYPLSQDRYLEVKQATVKKMNWLIVYGGTGVLLLTGIIILVRRKRK